MKNVIVAIVCLLLGAGGAVAYLAFARADAPAAPASATPAAHVATGGEAGYCAKHKLAEAECPFCNTALVAQKGQCEEHGFPEAICYQCNPQLLAAFKAEGDWCGGHNVPESQCALCDFGRIHEGPDAVPKD